MITHGLPLVILLLVGLSLLWPSYHGLRCDEEDFRFTIVSTRYHLAALAAGKYPFWNSQFGFGIPHPFSQQVIYHPLSFLFLLSDVDLAVSLFSHFHLLVGGYFLYLLLLALGIDRWIALVCSVSFLWSGPFLNFILTDFWVDNLVMMSLFPLLLFLLLRLLTLPPAGRLGRAILLGLTGGIYVLNGHMSSMPFLFAALLVFTLAFKKSAWEGWPYLLLVLAIVTLVGAFQGIHVLHELSFFDPMLSRPGQRVDLGDYAWSFFLKPFGNYPWVLATEYNLARGARNIFVGNFFAFLILIPVFRYRRFPPALLPFLLGFLFCAVVMCLPLELFARPLRLAGLLFLRGPFTVFAFVLLGYALHDRVRRPGWRNVVVVGTILQVLVILGNFWIFLENVRQEGFALFRPTPILRALQKHDPEGRIYFSEQLDRRVRSQALVRQGLNTNHLAFYGRRVVNGWFKGISADRFYPDLSYAYGQICGEFLVQSNSPSLNALGIRTVLAMKNEPVAPELQAVEEVPLGRETAVLYRNPAALPEAFFASRDLRGCNLARYRFRSPPPYPFPLHNRILAGDFSPLSRLLVSDPVALVHDYGELRLTFAPASRARHLVVMESYRPHWVADTGRGRIPVASALEGFIGMEVPAGVDRITLSYRPGFLFWPLCLSGATLAVGLVFLAGSGWSRKAGSK